MHHTPFRGQCFPRRPVIETDEEVCGSGRREPRWGSAGLMITGSMMRNIAAGYKKRRNTKCGADFAKRPYNWEQWAAKPLTHI